MSQRLKILNIVGARPNLPKIAPLMHEMLRHPEIEAILVHTGQPYDEKLSDIFFRQMGIPSPHVNLEVGSGSHASQTAEILKRIEPVLVERKPDLVLVVGDVNSTIAVSLAAAKLGIRVAHVEAGLRSFDRTMPEEINRILIYSLRHFLPIAQQSAIGDELELKNGAGWQRFGVLTLRRPSMLIPCKRSPSSSPPAMPLPRKRPSSSSASSHPAAFGQNGIQHHSQLRRLPRAGFPALLLPWSKPKRVLASSGGAH